MCGHGERCLNNCEILRLGVFCWNEFDTNSRDIDCPDGCVDVLEIVSSENYE